MGDRFEWPDYVVLVVVTLLSVTIGLVKSLRSHAQQTTDDYLMGGRSLNVVPVAFSVMASFVSAITVLGGPVEIYAFGASFWMNGFSYFLSVPITAHIFIPLFYKLRVKSAYEYLEMRFNHCIRVLASIVFTIQMVFYMAVVFYAPALTFSQVTGVSMWVAIVVTGLICTIYTTLGGLRAVVWTDLVQMLVVLGGMLALIIQGTLDVGGVGEVWRRAKEGGRLDVFNFDPNPMVRHTFWTLVFGGAITTLSVYAVNQAMVQRYLCVPTLKQAQGTIYFNLPGNVLTTTLVTSLGLVAFAKYKGCDPLKQGRIKAPDQMVPLLVVETLGALPGLPGFFVACVYSAALSTVSSGINALALVYLEDLAKPAFKRLRGTDMKESVAAWTSKILALVFGLLTVAMAFVTSAMGQTLIMVTLKIFGMTGGPLLAVFILAIFFPSANAWGAAVGLLFSTVFSFWLGIGAIVARPPLPYLSNTVDECPSSNVTATLLSNITTAAVTSFPDINTDVSLAFNASDITTAATVKAASGYTGLALYRLSYMWYSGASVLVGIIIGLVVSFITGGRRGRELNPSLVIPLWQKLEALVCRSRQYSMSNAKLETATQPIASTGTAASEKQATENNSVASPTESTTRI